MHVKWSSGRDIAVSLFILLGLAVPFVPVPGDRETQMEVRFHTSGMAAPHAFSTQTRHSICAVMSTALAFEDPRTGEYTRISCED
ncbi:MAG TPA: hypothetical protein VN795_02025 [Stellaceae bacterium]|nr:hypothetical protein [Stellaceae bacterium]